MLRNLNLYIETGRKPIEIPVHIDKITDAKTTLNTTMHGRRVRTVTVLTHGDVEKVTGIEDIELVVNRNETESGIEIQAPDGTTSIVTVDRKSSESELVDRNLRVIAVVASRTIKPYQYEGASYEISIYGKTVKKVKVVDPQHKQMFNILFHGLTANDQMLIAKYISFGREKFAAIYPVTQDTLVMSNLIHSSYYRPFISKQIVASDIIEASLSASLPPDMTTNTTSAMSFFYKQMIKALPTQLSPEDYQDKHELHLKTTIARLTACVVSGKEVPLVPLPEPEAPVHLQMLMDL